MNVVKTIIASKNGLTLVELIVGMGLTLLLLSAMLTNLSASLTVWQTGKTRSEIEQTARYALDTIVREIRYANNITLNSKSSLTITKNNSKTRKTEEKITFRYGSSNSKTIYKITDKTATGGGIGTNPLTPALFRDLEFRYNPTVDRNEVIIIIKATGNQGEPLEYCSLVRCLNVINE